MGNSYVNFNAFYVSSFCCGRPMVKNTGKSSEEDFELKLKRAYGKLCFIHRVTDTAEVRGRSGSKTAFTKAQPSDYLVTLKGKMHYAEVKSSNNKTSFPFSDITKQQWLTSKLQLLAKGEYIFYIQNMNTLLWYRVPAKVFHDHDKRSMKWDELNNYLWEL